MTARTRFVGAVLLAAASTLLAGAAPAETQPTQIRASDLIFGKAIVLGQLNKPLGTYMTVEGDYFGPRAMIKSGLDIESIDNIHRGMVINMDVEDRQLPARLEKGRRYRLRGFETGDFSGVPDDPQNPPTADELKQRQKVGPYTLDFSTRFYVTKIEDLGPFQGNR